MSFSSLLLLIPRAWSRRARPAAQATATPGPRAPQVRRGGAPAQAEGGCRSRLGTASGTGRGTWHCRRARRPGRRSRETFSLEVPRARPTPGATRGHGWPPTASAPPVEESRVPSRRSAGAGKREGKNDAKKAVEAERKSQAKRDTSQASEVEGVLPMPRFLVRWKGQLRRKCVCVWFRLNASH